MTDNTRSAAGIVLPKWSKFLGLMFLVAVAAMIWSKLPGAGYPTDLSVIGKGRPALVLAHDSNFTGGMAVMDLMNKIRDDYTERVDFLVVHLGMADGQEFARDHSAGDGTVLLFAADGRLVSVLQQPQSVPDLRQALKQAFGV